MKIMHTSTTRRSGIWAPMLLMLALFLSACGADDGDTDGDDDPTTAPTVAQTTEPEPTTEPTAEATTAAGPISREDAEAAALAEIGEGRVTGIEREDDHGAMWEVEITRPDGSEVDVYVAADGTIVRTSP